MDQRPDLRHFGGALRTRRGCITIYWMFHSTNGTVGWVFCGIGKGIMLTKICLN